MRRAFPRPIKAALRWLVVAIVAAPVVALVAGSALDREGARVVVTPLPLALALWGPLVREFLWNSAWVASIVAGLGLVIGSALGVAVAGARFRGRSALEAWAWFPSCVPPALLALAWARVVLVKGASFGEGKFAINGWLALIIVGLTWAVPTVAMATLRALDTMGTVWRDAALALGARRRQAWRLIVWPLLRPKLAQATARVFALMLVEPGAPLVLGLRRTVGFQLVDLATRGDGGAAASALGALALGLAVLGGALIRWRGGHETPLEPASDSTRAWRSGWRASWWVALLLAGWAVVSTLPLLALVADEVRTLSQAVRTGEGLSWIAPLLPVLRNGLGVGLAATVLGLALAALLTGQGEARPRSFVVALAGHVPPLLLGIGALSLLWPGPGVVGSDLGLVDRWGTLALVAVLAIVPLPTLLRLADRVREGGGRHAHETAWLLTGSRWAAWRRVTLPDLWRGLSAPLFLIACRAAFDAGPSLVLASQVVDRRLPGPVLVAALDVPGGVEFASTLAALGTLTLLAAWLAAFSTRPGRGEGPGPG